MAYKITMVLDMLSDGKWHELDMLQQAMKLDCHEIEEITKFLSEYHLAEFDQENGRVKITRDFQKIPAQNTS